jgi:hypothetical protein
LESPTRLYSTLFENEENSKDDIDDSSSKATYQQETQGTYTVISNIELQSMPTSYLHMLQAKVIPSSLHILETNTQIKLPAEKTLQNSILIDLKRLGDASKDDFQRNACSALSSPHPDPESAMYNLTRDFIDQTVYLNSTIPSPALSSEQNIVKNEETAQHVQESAYKIICEKLAVISVDLIKNQINL